MKPLALISGCRGALRLKGKAGLLRQAIVERMTAVKRAGGILLSCSPASILPTKRV
jgi:hypothetical protein